IERRLAKAKVVGLSPITRSKTFLEIRHTSATPIFFMVLGDGATRLARTRDPAAQWRRFIPMAFINQKIWTSS
ncbi:MAG: hypothetical protein AB7K41_13500, partial [Bdellovibrionales bacterium]